MIAELEKTINAWLNEERPDASDQDYTAWWNEYQYLGPKVQRYLMLKVATAMREEKFATPMSAALAEDAPAHDPFGLHPAGSSQTKVNDAIAAMTEQLDQLRGSMGSSAQDRTAFAVALDTTSRMAAQLGQWDAATTWSAETVQLFKGLADEDWQGYAEMLGLALIAHSAMLGMSVQDPKAYQRRQTEVFRTSLEDLRSDPKEGMMLMAERIEERLTACTEAIQIFRTLSEESGSNDVLRHLIGALGNYAGVLLDDHRPDEAEAAAWEAVERCRAASSDVSMLPDLARSLHNAGVLVTRRKDGASDEGAVSAVKEAGALYVQLTLARQGTYLHELTEVTKCLKEIGEHEAAEGLIAAVQPR
jgi:hypothetical protein